MKKQVINPMVSVVIPVKNGAGTIRECLDGIFSQTIAGKLEVIVVDSGSGDGTLEILGQYPVIVRSIDPASFNHGLTRNLGASLARGEYIVFTVQDAVPSGPEWLETLLESFRDPAVAGVCGQQAVDHHPSKNPLQWFRPAGPAEVRKIHSPDFEMLPPESRHELCRWDNVNAAYRRSALLEIPFRPASFGEDALWAMDALEAGKTLVFDYRARVWHYHHQSFSFYFRRSYIIFYQDWRNFRYLQGGHPLIKTVPMVLYRMFRMPVRAGEKIYWTRYNLNLAWAKFLAKTVFRFLNMTAGDRGLDLGLNVFCHQVPQGRRKDQ